VLLKERMRHTLVWSSARINSLFFESLLSKYVLTYIPWPEWDPFVIQIHPWDNYRHLPRTFKSKHICFLEDRKMKQNLITERKKRPHSVLTRDLS
jgi:hypothetical protein